MEPTDIASHVEQYDHTHLNNCLRKMGNPEQIIAGANWIVCFTSADGISTTSYRTGFRTKNEAESFRKGWNSHRSKVSELLFNKVTFMIKKKKV